MKEDNIKETLDSLGKKWSFDYLINGDVKFDNFMFDSEAPKGVCAWQLIETIDPSKG